MERSQRSAIQQMQLDAIGRSISRQMHGGLNVEVTETTSTMPKPTAIGECGWAAIHKRTPLEQGECLVVRQRGGDRGRSVRVQSSWLNCVSHAATAGQRNEDAEVLW